MRDLSELSEFTQKALRKVFAKDPLDLVEEEKDIIRARREYLSSDLEKKFADVLEVKEEKVAKSPKKSAK